MFTKEELDILIPDLEVPMTRDEYLNTLKFHNVDSPSFEEVMNYDPQEDERLSKYIATRMEDGGCVV